MGKNNIMTPLIGVVSKYEGMTVTLAQLMEDTGFSKIQCQSGMNRMLNSIDVDIDVVQQGNVWRVNSMKSRAADVTKPAVAIPTKRDTAVRQITVRPIGYLELAIINIANDDSIIGVDTTGGCSTRVGCSPPKSGGQPVDTGRPPELV